jgi:hypothetical protein
MDHGANSGMTVALRYALLCVLSVTPLSQSAAQTLPGRLFFTAAERAMLDRQRLSAGDAPTQHLRLDGIVQPSRAAPSAWVNGRPAAAVVDTAELQVGETLNPATRERTDLLASGAVRIRQSPVAPPR